MPTNDQAGSGPSSAQLSARRNTARLTSRGGLQRLDVAGLSMLLYPAGEFDAGLTNLWLRRDGQAASLLGTTSAGALCSDDGLVRGRALGLDYAVRLVLADGADAWFWHVQLANPGGDEVTVELVHTADVALTPYDAVRINEYYVSQYLDLTPIDVPGHGLALAVRQNMPSKQVPWVLLGTSATGEHWATDARQVLGREQGHAVLDLSGELPDARLQHEHTLATLGTGSIVVPAGGTTSTSFYGHLITDHPEATGPDDARHALAALALPEARPGDGDLGDAVSAPPANLFQAPALEALELDAAALDRRFPGRTLVEHAPDGSEWAFRHGDEAVTLAAKQTAVLRPHGHILRTGSSLAPETDVLTSTIWMDGGFASQVTQGHVSRNRILSTRRTYLGLQRAQGLRILVDLGEGWRLLVRPSAWSLRPDRARWTYLTEHGEVTVQAGSSADDHRLQLVVDSPAGARVLLALNTALGEDDGLVPASLPLQVQGNRVVAGEPGRCVTLDFSHEPVVGGDEVLTGGRSLGLPWLTCRFDGQQHVEMSLRADTVPTDEAVVSSVTQPDVWRALAEQLGVELPSGEMAGQVAQLDATLAWYEHNALVHFLSPRGLEQYTGGGWGTRDVCQGPVGLLTAIDRPDAVREVVRTVFRSQNERGDWPQAFDFLPPLQQSGQWDSHGDVVYWPLLMTAEHLLRTRDASLLDDRVSMVGDQARTEPLPITEHLRRAVARIAEGTVPGMVLPAYGHGDWNDSLQPADPKLASHMVSAWTSVLQAHTLRQLADALAAVDAEPELAAECLRLAKATGNELHRHLVADGEMAGYGVVSDGGVELLVHPRDQRTGLTHGILPWIHAISADLLTRDEARHHLDLLREHLWGPDGARLFDRPASYRGGRMEVFQRAEAATFWGREIGLMYTHAHLRTAEALARFGDAEWLWQTMMLAHPVGLEERCEQARPRQTSCYYSSSDAVFSDRAEAAERYGELMAGGIEVEGGWRVYSSGPGLWLRLLVENVLGIRVRGGDLEVDPVLDPRLDGLVARVPVDGRVLRITYRVRGTGSGVTAVTSAGRQVQGTELANPYRDGGVVVALAELADDLTVEVGR